MFTGLSELRVLKLWQNRISSMQANSFNGLGLLCKLHLQNNTLRELRTDDFQGMDSLEQLWLSNNEVALIQNGAFNGLSTLKELSLLGNRLQGLRIWTFEGLVSLERLWLSGNSLSVMDSRVFSLLPRPLAVNLRDNPIACNRRLCWLKQEAGTTWFPLDQSQLLDCAEGTNWDRVPAVDCPPQGKSRASLLPI